MTTTGPGDEPQQLPAEALRKAALEARRAIEAARPRVSEAVERARPQVERVAQQAKEYAREHDSELKRAAVYLARFAVPRPLRTAFDILTPSVRPAPGVSESAQPAAGPTSEVVTGLKCHACAWLNPELSRFCNQCGTALARVEADP